MRHRKEEKFADEKRIETIFEEKSSENLRGVELSEEEAEQVTGGIIWIPERDGTRKKKTP